MQDSVQASSSPRASDGARDLQATLYREIGISAVAAALQSIGKPDPATPSTEAAASTQRPAVRAVRVA